MTHRPAPRRAGAATRRLSAPVDAPLRWGVLAALLATALVVSAAVVVAVTGGPAGAQAVDADIPPLEGPAAAVYPWADGDLRYSDPVAAARGFAVDYLGMHDPVLSEFRPGDSRSGEVEIGDAPGLRRNTTVFLRQLDDDGSWWVLGSVTGDVQVDRPRLYETISSPVTVSGMSSSFEANVPVEIRQDLSTTPIGTGYVMGGALEPLEPFEGEIAFDAPGTPYGTVLFLVPDMEHGGVAAATVLRVRFAPPSPTTTTTTTVAGPPTTVAGPTTTVAGAPTTTISTGAGAGAGSGTGSGSGLEGPEAVVAEPTYTG